MSDQLVWSMANKCRDDDVVIVGVGTPLATCAVQLARQLLCPDLTILVGTAVDPDPFDVAGAAHVGRYSAGSLGQTQVLDLLQRGDVTLQFVSPAQVDPEGRINASRVRVESGWRRLPGSLALPDTAALVGRLVAFRRSHRSRFLVPRVDYVSGAGRVDAILTDVAELSGSRLVALQPGASLDEAVDGCGFALDVPDPIPVVSAPPAEAVSLLDRVIDPSGLRHL